jgi:hypothetical protein
VVADWAKVRACKARRNAANKVTAREPERIKASFSTMALPSDCVYPGT